jgi:serine protease inhibitor
MIAKDRWITALLLGFAFEATQILTMTAGPPSGWFFVEFYNFSSICHYPFLLAVMATRNDIFEATIFFIFEGALVWFWAFIFIRFSALVKKFFAGNKILDNRKVLATCGVIILAGTWVSGKILETYFDRATPFTASPDTKTVVGGNNAFALDLYQRLKTRPGNLFFSPYSISTGAGMLYAGARGPTESEIAATFHFGTEMKLQTSMRELSARMNAVQHWNHLKLISANSLWYQRDYPLRADFVSLIRTNYEGEVFPVDFSQGAQVAGEMGKWISHKTSGRIKNAVSPEMFDQSTALALCDAIYFKGKWASPFGRNKTKPGNFNITTNQTVTVPMMRQESPFKLTYSEDFSLSFLEMPYYGHDLSMVVMLPHNVDGLADLETQLTAANLQEWLAKLNQCSPEKTIVVLPRFSITKNIDLKKELPTMGVNSLFDSEADLSGMDGRTNLYISDFFHQAFVDVNEEGTEASAITVEIAKTKSITLSFVANHPFIFLIRDNASGSILFMGRMTDPSRQ